MTATADRIQELARQHLDIDGDLDMDAALGNAGVSSLDAVAFIKRVGDAFGVAVPPEDVAKWKTMRDFASYLDSHSG